MSIEDRTSSNKFDGVLELCLNQMQSGQTLETCLRQYSEWADRLEPLLRAAQMVTAMPKPAMSIGSREVLARQLQAEMRARPVTRPSHAYSLRRSRFNWLRPVAILAALALMFSMVGAGTVAASAVSLPGDVLYPVKRWSESVSITFTSDTNARAQLHLDWAQRRLFEFEQLDEHGIVDQTLLADADAEMQNAIILSASLADVPHNHVLNRVVAVNTTAMDVVNRVRAHAPQAAAYGLETALNELKETRAIALEELPPMVEPETAATNTPRPTSTHIPRPSSTDALPASTAPAESPQPQSTRTPPGQGTPKGGLTKTPSSQGNQGGDASTSQPNHGNPGGGNGNGGGDGNGNGGNGNGNGNGGGGKIP